MQGKPTITEHLQKELNTILLRYMKDNMITIYSPIDPAREYRIYFTDRTGKKVFCYYEDPQSLLNLRQKEDFFLGGCGAFLVNESDIRLLEKLINWPA
jgi:hypothetical protein